MKQLYTTLLFICFIQFGYTQIQLPTGTNITSFNTAGEGDLYEDSDGEIYIGLSNGSLKIIPSATSNSQTSRINDADNNTFVDTELNANENRVRIGLNGNEKWVFRDNRIENFNTNNSLNIGLNSGTNNSGTNNVFIGEQTGTNSGTATQNTFIGNSAGTNNQGNLNSYIGFQAGQNSNSGANNAFFGALAGENISGSNNLYSGKSAGENSGAGQQNVFLGKETGKNRIGSNNVTLGFQTAINGGTGANNVEIGSQVATNSEGSNNIFIGFQAANNNLSGSRNIVIGNDIDVPNATANEQLNIGNLIFSQGVNQTGTNISTGNIGIGVTNPTDKLDVNGTARVRTLNTAATDDVIVTASTTGVLNQSKINFGGRWTNTDTTTNLNVNNTITPIFGTEDYKDDGNTLYQVSGNTLIVKESGRYDIRANLSFTGSTDRTNMVARIFINNNPIGALSATGYIRIRDGHNQSSLHLNEILELSANDVITIKTSREAANGAVRFNSAAQSSFMINKLR